MCVFFSSFVDWIRGKCDAAVGVRPRLWSRVWTILLVAVGAGGLEAAQTYRPTISDPLLDGWRWQTYTELEGKGPRCMVEGQDGAMWFGIGQGVIRYDGEKWVNYTSADGLVGTTTNILCRAPTGEIYAGTTSGISRFADGKWQRVFPTNEKEKANINSLLVATDGSIWAIANTGLLHIKSGAAEFFVTEGLSPAIAAAFPDVKVQVVPPIASLRPFNSVYETRDGMIWFAGYGGQIVRHDPRIQSLEAPAAWRMFTKDDGLREVFDQKCFYQTEDGALWVGGGQPNGAINRFDPEKDTWSQFDLIQLLGVDNLIRSIVETRDGSLWFGGLSRIARYKEGQWHAYTAPAIPISPSRISLLESQSGELWLLGLGDDVQKVDRRGDRWQRYEGLNYQCETPDGRQWFIAWDDGVVSFDGHQWLRYDQSDGLMRSPYGVFCTRGGQLWVAGTESDRAVTAWLEPDGWHKKVHDGYTPKCGFIIDGRAICESEDGSLWFGSYVNGRSFGGADGGILQYDPKLGPPGDQRAWKNHLTPVMRYTSGIAQAADGTLYHGFYGGFFEFQNNAWVASTRIPNKNVEVLCRAPDGKVWVGTRGDGVYQIDGPTTRQFTMRDGLRANAVTAVFSDRDGHLWVGTSNGLSHYDGQEWTADALPDAKITMGLEGGTFNQSKDGALWINLSSRNWQRRVLPENRNVVLSAQRFSTVRYAPEHTTPRVEIVTAVKRVSQAGNTVIAWRGYVPWWRTKPGDLRYSQRLDGGPWTKFTGETNHVFLQLAPGPHRFEVRVRDRDFNSSLAPATLEFVVVPPVWQERWFQVLMGVLTAVIVTQTVRVILRGRNLRRSNRALAIEIEEHKRAELELAQKNERLEQEIEARTRMEREVERTHKELMMASRQAGMAEVATSVLHNVGNVLNSVNVSATLITERVRKLKVGGLAKTADLLQTNAATPDFLSADPKGRQIGEYLKSLGEHMTGEQTASLHELDSLRQNIDHIKEIVAMQQSYSRLSGVSETIKISEIIADAVRMNAGALQRHEVKLELDYRDDLTIEVEKHKVLQILVNLIRNAKYACDESGRLDKRVTIRIVRSVPERVEIHVIDNGVGIPAENMTRIFQHGFTTRKEGHGFGLHSCANAAKELGGSVIAKSDGPGKGATFIIDLPVRMVANRSGPAAVVVAAN